MYVYQGSDRRNTTSVIQGDVAMVVGAPVRVPVTEGAIITMQSTGAQARTGTGKFSFKVVGTYYSWYERPFIGISVAFYYITVSIIFIVGTIVGLPTVLVLITLVLVILLILISILVPCIPLGFCVVVGAAIWYAVKNRKGSKSARLRKGRTRNSRFGRGSRRDGIQSFSPPGGKGQGPPKKLGGNSI